MAYNVYKIFILIFALGILSSPAFAQYTSKGSFDYLKDDGIFSNEEKDQEAELIKQQCERSVLEQKFFDCTCLAGAFRIKRDEEQLTPQSTIMYDLLNKGNGDCVDTAKIAGSSYLQCQETVNVFRAREKDNEEYCQCVSNSIAKEFALKPRARLNHIGNIRVQAMQSCDKRTSGFTP